jgi:hypothetical protein
MGAIAIRRALADASVEWRDIQFAFGGSYEVDNPDAGGRAPGLTGIPFTERLQRLRDRGERPRAGRRHDPAGRARARPRRRHGQAPPGAFSSDPRLYACPSWYGELGHFLTRSSSG